MFSDDELMVRRCDKYNEPHSEECDCAGPATRDATSEAVKPGPIEDQIQEVIDFAEFGLEEKQYLIRSDLHNAANYDDDDRERFKQTEADCTAGIKVIAALPGMVEILEKILNDIQYGRIGRNDGIVYDSVTWRQITNALTKAKE